MTTAESSSSSRSVHVPGWVALLAAIVALLLAATALTVSLMGVTGTGLAGMMSGRGMMSDGGTAFGRGGMMSGRGGTTPYSGPAAGAQPGVPGFVAGSASSPRVIPVTAGPGLSFWPSSISVVRGETVTFVVTTMGPTTHEFMVGPADAVAADAPGTSEIAEIRIMETKALTYTFDGSGPFAFACHAPGHYEAGMRGTITVLPA